MAEFYTAPMPDAPFTEDDIIIEFAPKSKMALRAKALCAQYVPDKNINDSQARLLSESISANALIGRKKFATIAHINYKLGEQNWRRIFFHEFMHIYCASVYDRSTQIVTLIFKRPAWA